MSGRGRIMENCLHDSVVKGVIGLDWNASRKYPLGFLNVYLYTYLFI